MADYTLPIFLATTLMFIFLTLHAEHKWAAGIAYILTGIGALLITEVNNPFGLIIILIGFYTIAVAPWEKSKHVGG